ncbi:MAG: nucleotidyltransferase [Deltaproteobacteria bacterium]|nr:MAG: nucleotidyltransferase [Deltaproteobacteria bacterium]
MPLSRQPTPQRKEFVERFEEQLLWFMRHLDRPAALALLADLSDSLARERGAILNMEKSRTEMLARVTQSSSYAELHDIEQALTALEIARFLSCGSVTGLHRGCTEYRDLLAARTLAMVGEELEARGDGAPPRPFALISMGSDGREEQTLVTDQDYLIVYADGGGEAADEYFRSFSELLVERLAEVGFAKCTGDIMPSNPTWRGSRQQWKQRLMAIVRYEYEEYAKNLMDLIVLSDARFVAGDRAIAADLIELIHDFEQSYFQVLWGMARAATEMKVGLGMLGGLWTDRSGEHKGKLNLKLLGWAPLVMNVRILAVNMGATATNTLKRIALLQEDKRLSPANAAELQEAYHVLTRHRILLQICKLRGECADSYYLDPETLSDAEEEELRQAMVSVRDLQKVIRTNFSTM